MPRVATNQNGRESVRLFVQPPLCHTSIFTQPRILYGCRITESIDERRVWPAAHTYFITHRHTHTHSIKLYSSWENQGTSPCWTVCNRKSYKSLYWQTATKNMKSEAHLNHWLSWVLHPTRHDMQGSHSTLRTKIQDFFRTWDTKKISTYFCTVSGGPEPMNLIAKQDTEN